MKKKILIITIIIVGVILIVLSLLSFLPNKTAMRANLNQCFSNINDDEFKKATLNEFYGSDSNGFLIRRRKLIAYFGLKKKLVIPDYVKEIEADALAWDCCHAQKVKVLVIPGSVKRLRSHSLAFINADTVIFKEGVETFDKHAFLDSYLYDVYFPSTIKNFPKSLMNPEEGVMNGLTLHFTKNSKVGKEVYKEYKNDNNVKVVFDNK